MLKKFVKGFDEHSLTLKTGEDKPAQGQDNADKKIKQMAMNAVSPELK